jgi:hypothetical protein
MTRKELEKILDVKLIIKHDKGCFCIKGRDWSNYATIRKQVGHRLVYKICNGPIIPGQIICHKCDRKGCLNPLHLFQGTYSDNMWDAVRKGRSTYGRGIQR